MCFKTLPSAALSLFSLLHYIQQLGPLKLQGKEWKIGHPAALESLLSSGTDIRDEGEDCPAKASNGSKDCLGTAMEGNTTCQCDLLGTPQARGPAASRPSQALSQWRTSRRIRWLCTELLVEQRAALQFAKVNLQYREAPTSFSGLLYIHDFISCIKKIHIGPRKH